MLAGRRIVLGVTGGIAAYKAIEVCRRLVDAGAHVVPGADRGRARASSARPRSRRWRPSRCRPRCGDERRPDPAHPPRPDAPTSSSCARPPPGCSAPTPPASPTTCSPPPCSPPGRRWWSARRCTPRCGSTRRCRTTCATLRRAGACASSPPEEGRLAGGDVGAGRLADPADIVAAVERGARAPRTSPACACSSPPAAPASRSTRCASSATARRASRATPSPTRPRPRGAEVTLVTTVDRPVAGRRRGRAGRDRGRDGAGGAGPGRRRRRRRHGRGGGRLPARRRRPTSKIKKAEGVPDDRARADPRHPRRPRRAPSGPARCWSASPPRPSDVRRQRRRTSWSARALDLIVANDVSAPGVGFEHDTNAGRDRLGADGMEHEVPLGRQAGGGRGGPRRRRGPPPSVCRPALTATTTRQEPRCDPLHLHLGVGHRGPSRQDGRPDLRRRSSTPSSPQDPMARVACETLVTTGLAVVAGEITTDGLRRDPQASSARRSAASATTASPTASTATPAASSPRSTRSRPTSPRASTPPTRPAPARRARTSSTPRAPATRG